MTSIEIFIENIFNLFRTLESFRFLIMKNVRFFLLNSLGAEKKLKTGMEFLQSCKTLNSILKSTKNSHVIPRWNPARIQNDSCVRIHQEL